MEMYIIALVVYLALFVISSLASKSFQVKPVTSNTISNPKLIKETIIRNPEIIASK